MLKPFSELDTTAQRFARDTGVLPLGYAAPSDALFRDDEHMYRQEVLHMKARLTEKRKRGLRAILSSIEENRAASSETGGDLNPDGAEFAPEVQAAVEFLEALLQELFVEKQPRNCLRVNCVEPARDESNYCAAHAPEDQPRKRRPIG